MNPSIRKELEDSANPVASWHVAEADDGSWAAIKSHPSLGIEDVVTDFVSAVEAQSWIDGLTIEDEDEVSMIDLEIANDDDSWLDANDPFYLSENRGDVPSHAVLDPADIEGGTIRLRRVYPL